MYIDTPLEADVTDSVRSALDDSSGPADTVLRSESEDTLTFFRGYARSSSHSGDDSMTRPLLRRRNKSEICHTLGEMG